LARFPIAAKRLGRAPAQVTLWLSEMGPAGTASTEPLSQPTPRHFATLKPPLSKALTLGDVFSPYAAKPNILLPKVLMLCRVF
jgi:hypothetical protein